LIRGGEITTVDGINSVDEIFGFTIIRPLLNVPRFQILQYLKQIDATNWNKDESNDDNTYSRNFLRNEVIPLIKSKFSNFDTSMIEFAEKMKHAVEYKNRYLENFFNGDFVDFKKLFDLYNSNDAFSKDLAISIIYHGASTRLNVFLSRAQLLAACKMLFTYKHGKTKNNATISVGEFTCHKTVINNVIAVKFSK
jgi:tRNA(Ile)-lysidine synthase TilS/MesJ